MSGDLLEIIRIAATRYPNDDEKAEAFARRMMGLYFVEPPAGPQNNGTALSGQCQDNVSAPAEPETAPEHEREAAPEPIRPEPESTSKDIRPAPASALGKTADQIWRYIAKTISETGRSPAQSAVAEALGLSSRLVAYHVKHLRYAGYLRAEGSTLSMVLHLDRWPEGVAPRATEGRIGGGVNGNAPRLTRHAEQGKPKRRFDHVPFDPTCVAGLDKNHPAVREGRTLFPTTVVAPEDSPRLLVSGVNQSKLGDRVTKGPWSGMPIFGLTLEERRTCPTSCHHWTTCYGNGSPRARRHRHGPELLAALHVELGQLQEAHPAGFVVRLHMLGDFWSVEYVNHWSAWLELFPALRVFGYTAWQPGTEIGARIQHMRDTQWDRFAIRFSSATPVPGGATTIKRRERGRIPEGVVCPAQTEENVACGSCGLCWHPNMKDESIVFMEHGRRLKGYPAEAPAAPAAIEPAKPAPAVERKPEPVAPAKAQPTPVAHRAPATDERRLIDEAIAAGKVRKVSETGFVEERDAIDQLMNWMRRGGYPLAVKVDAPNGLYFTVDGMRKLNLEDLFREGIFKRLQAPVTKEQIKSALLMRRTRGAA